MATVLRNCDNCGCLYEADTRNLARGWGKCCSKSCAATLREKSAGTKQEKPARRLTYDELVARANATEKKAKPRHIESHLQRNCFTWFRLQYPRLRLLLFAVPNGGFRNKKEAGIMKAEGVTAGVADVILLIPSGGFASLCVEFKTEDGRQRATQKEWQTAAEGAGNKYVIVRSFDEFKDEIEKYLTPVNNNG